MNIVQINGAIDQLWLDILVVTVTGFHLRYEIRLQYTNVPVAMMVSLWRCIRIIAVCLLVSPTFLASPFGALTR